MRRRRKSEEKLYSKLFKLVFLFMYSGVSGFSLFHARKICDRNLCAFALEKTHT